jgi:hypothetical protein
MRSNVTAAVGDCRLASTIVLRSCSSRGRVAEGGADVVEMHGGAAADVEALPMGQGRVVGVAVSRERDPVCSHHRRERVHVTAVGAVEHRRVSKCRACAEDKRQIEAMARLQLAIG